MHTANSPRNLHWLLAVVGVLGVFFGANHLLVRGKAAALWDGDSHFGPYQMLVADHARAGRFLLWNPWTNGGSPDFAQPETGAFSPMAVLVGVITGGTEGGFRAYWLLIWLLPGLGTLALARHLNAPPWGALVAALGFLFSGIFVGNAQHISWLHSIAWLPWLIWRLDVALQRRQIRPAVEAGAIWGLSALAGYPGLTILSAGYALLWSLGRWCCAGPPGAGRDRISNKSSIPSTARLTVLPVLRSTAMMLVIGVLVLCPTYAAFFIEGRGFSDRVNSLPREIVVLENALHPGALSTFASPYLPTLWFYNRPNLWPYNDGSSCSIYVGAVVAWLALLALVGRPKDAWRWWLFGMGALSLAFALAQVLPFRGWLYDLLPPTRFFRHASIFRDYAIFSGVVLALLGTRDMALTLRQRSHTSWWMLTVAAVPLGVAAIVSFVAVMRSVENPGAQRQLAEMHVWAIWLGVGTAAIVGGVLRGSRRAAILPSILIFLSAGDAFLTHRLSETIYTTEPSVLESWRKIDARRTGSLDLARVGFARIASITKGLYATNKNLPLKIPVLEGDSPFKNRFHLLWANHALLTAVATGDHRIWFSQDIVALDASNAAFEAFKRRTEILGAPPLVIHSPKGLRRGAKRGETPPDGVSQTDRIHVLPAASQISVDLLTYRPNELAFNVQCPSDGWLLVTDRWARGWRATVNGESTPVWGGNFIFRAIPVRGGWNAVRFTYHPFGFPALLALSWSTLALVGSWSLWVAWRGGGRHPHPVVGPQAA